MKGIPQVYSIVLHEKVNEQVAEIINDRLETEFADESKNIINVTQSTCYDSENEEVMLTVVIFYHLV